MKLSSLTLTGRTVRLEPLAAGHHAALERCGAEAEVWRWTGFLHADPRESVRGWCATLGAMQARGEAVGGTTLFDYSAANRRVEIGYTWLARSAWRTAVNTEAKALLLGHAFETVGCGRVQLKTDARNERSQAAIARIGAVREGVLRSHLVMPDGFVRDSVMFSVVAGEWPGVKERLRQLMNRGSAA
jgi:RimJ/RimL family protein N-acetyltransferase